MTRRLKPASHAGRQQPEQEAAPSRRRAWWPFPSIVLLSVLVYANALNNPFIFDDLHSVTDNPTLKSLATAIRGGPIQDPTAGRPLVNLSLAINYGWSGTDPWVYHATNLVILALCGCVLFALLRRVLELPRLGALAAGRETPIAAAVALIWTAHPLLSETVNYVTQRTESMMALAYLATLYAGVRGMTTPRPVLWYGASALACAAGMACKESMVTAPAVVLLVDAVFVSGGLVNALRSRPAYYAALGTTWLVLAGLNFNGPRFRSAGFQSGVSPSTYLLNQGPMIARYLRLAVAPVGLVLDYGKPVAIPLSRAWPSIAFVTALVIVSLAAWRRWPAVAFLGTTFFVLLGPTSSFVPIATEVGAERRMFLPLVLLVTFVVVAAVRLLEHLPAPSRRPVAFAVTSLAVVLLGAATVQRNREYATRLLIWQTVVDRWPTGRAYYNLGIELKEAGHRAEALAAYVRAMGDNADAHYAFGFERQMDGRYEEAAAHYREYIRLEPDDANVLRAYHQLGRTLVSLGRYDQALEAFREVLVRRPGDLDATGGIASALLELGRVSEAVATYRAYLEKAPGNTAARFNLGLALLRTENYADAATTFTTLLAAEPANVAAHVNLARALAQLRRVPEAIRELERAAELESDPVAREELRQIARDLRAVRP